MKGEIHVTGGAVRAEFDFWVGLYLDKFYAALEQNKFIGNKCPKCGKVYCPPRKKCGDDFATLPLDDASAWVDLPNTGTLINFTYTPWQVTERRARLKKKNEPIGLVKIDGADSAMFVPILDIEPENLKTGMKVEVVWNKKNKGGHPEDIAGFKPAGGG